MDINQAIKIMGKSNVFTIKQVIECFGEQQPHFVEYLANIPFSEEELDLYKNSHILFPCFRTSIEDMREVVSRDLEGEDKILGGKIRFEIDPTQVHGALYYFSEETRARWCLVEKMPKPLMSRKNILKLEKELKPNEQFLSATVVIYMLLLMEYVDKNLSEKFYKYYYNKILQIPFRPDIFTKSEASFIEYETLEIRAFFGNRGGNSYESDYECLDSHVSVRVASKFKELELECHPIENNDKSIKEIVLTEVIVLDDMEDSD